jgi:hypothetical protein
LSLSRSLTVKPKLTTEEVNALMRKRIRELKKELVAARWERFLAECRVMRIWRGWDDITNAFRDLPPRCPNPKDPTV